MLDKEFLKLCEMRANFYMCSALTGHAKFNTTTHSDGTPLTDQEKINAAVEAAKAHILQYQERLERMEFFHPYKKS